MMTLLQFFRTAFLLITVSFSLPGLSEEITDVDFNRDIRPILSDKCFHCHGPDAKNQSSDLRLDTREQALMEHNGVRGIVPGDVDESEVSWRIHLPNDDIDVMPPLDSNRVLSKREKALLDAWIKQGADYDIHWSFKKPVKNELPGKQKNPIDAFVLERLQQEEITPQPEANLEARLRRASLSLTGLLPEVADMDSALTSPDADQAYETFVDQLLASPHYAERQTLRWLSAARYADTDGYQIDTGRTNWPWRDWVIQAFKTNMPFDQFTIEQLAGDMLPEPSKEQLLATAFNRNHRQNAEGGALAAEFLVENVIDRVETTSTVWLGLTMGCARCHDHKYDPLSQKEFFQMYAYFNNIGERGTGKGIQANPMMDFSSPLVKAPPELVTEREAAKAQLKTANAGFNKRRDAWIEQATNSLTEKSRDWLAQSEFVSTKVTKGTGELILEDGGSILFAGQNVEKASYEIVFTPANQTKVTGIRIDALPHPAFGKPRQLARSVNGNFVLTEVELEVLNTETNQARPIKITGAEASFEQAKFPIGNAIDGNPNSGWAVFDKTPETVTAWFVPDKPIELGDNEQIRLRLAHNTHYVDHNIGRFKILLSDNEVKTGGAPTFSPKILSALEVPAKKRSSREIRALTGFYRTMDEPLKKAEAAIKRVENKLKAAGASVVPVMVMSERDGERSPAYLLDRGQYDAPDLSEKLNRAVPVAFFDGEEEDQPQDRLELARWIVSERNPLTARVVVNRIWQDHFGVGLVKTSEDFGSQSELPSHPKLLDWLAVELIESGWNIKALHKTIVMSDTFQQGTFVDPALLERDPENRLLARGPRYRLDGFAIRDVALQASGLLDPRLGGPPVKPYQPEGLWSNLGASANNRYVPAKGSDLYRKTLYTYWKRSVNPPRQLIFDAGGREACDVSLRRTNTPLQALVLMNDVTFLEAARKLAERVITKETEIDARISEIYRTATALKVKPSQLKVLKDNFTYFQKHFTDQPEEAAEFLKAGMSPRDESIPAPEHAAWTAVAHLVLNMDSTITLQ